MHALSCQLLSILLALGWWRLDSLSGGMHKQTHKIAQQDVYYAKVSEIKKFHATYHCDQPPFPVNPLAPPPWSVAGLGSTHCGHQNGDVGKSGGLAGCSTRSRHLNNFFPFFGSLQFKGNLKRSGVHRSIQLISI